MSVEKKDILTAVELLDRNDPEQWDASNGLPVLAAVQRVMQNDKVTNADVVKALAPDPAADKPKGKATDGGTKAAATETVQPPVAAKTMPGDLPDPDADKQEVIGELSQTELALRHADELKAAKAQLQPAVDDLERQKAELDAKLEAAKNAVIAIDVQIEETTAQISDADMVKRIQKQTQDRLKAQAEAQGKINAVMGAAGVKAYASPLDQALAAGARRSKVIVKPGEVFEAPHPRSPEGIKNYAGWIHRGQGSAA
jgi:hypothetical protein